MSTFPKKLLRSAKDLLKQMEANELMLTTAESCTGGLISALLTEIPGSAYVFTHGFVTYANDAKKSMIGVPQKILKANGAVSKEVAIAMAEGALKAAKADISIAVTGIAGPTGATPGKPVGLVHIASARRGQKTLHQEYRFKGGRSNVRLQTVEAALELLKKQTG